MIVGASRIRGAVRSFGVAILLSLIGGCTAQDSDYIPYALTGYDVWVYDDTSDREFYGGRIESSYLTRKAGLDQCGDAAEDLADTRHLKDWSYVCCTVTIQSECVTKVR